MTAGATQPAVLQADAKAMQERWLSDLETALRKLHVNPGQHSPAFYRARVLKIITADCVDRGIGQAEVDAALSAGTLHMLAAGVMLV